MVRSGVMVVALVSLACGSRGNGQGEGSGDAGETTAGTTVGATVGTTVGSDSTSTGGGPTDGGAYVPPPPDLPSACDPVEQDCPDGEKCVYVQKPPGYRCVDVTGSLGLGERCLAQNGADPCGVGLVCIAGSDLSDVGICMALCNPDGPEAWCQETWGYAMATCEAHGPNGLYPVCDAECSPHTEDCPPGLSCTAISSSPPWECVVAGAAADGEACEHSVDCVEGNFCTYASDLADCDHEFCCNLLCDSFTETGCVGPGEACHWWCQADTDPGRPRCQCASEWDCARGLCYVPK
jgi:hypothetical protein